MEKTYFVLYQRDRPGERIEMAKGRMLYDRINLYRTKILAAAFGFSHLKDSPILARSIDDVNNLTSHSGYVVAAYFPSKYKHYDYGGGSDDVPTHEVVRCDSNDLENVVSQIASESPERIYLGIEERLFPDSLKTLVDGPD